MLYRNPLNDKEFLKQLDKQKEREVFVKLIALDKKESPLQEIQGRTTGGNVNIDGNSAARRTCSLSMVAQDVDINSFYWGLYNKFKVEIGIKNTIDRNNYDDIIWFPQGVYIITNFSTSQNTNSFNISISGKDKMCLLNGDISGNIPYQTDFGTEEVIEYEYEEINFTDKEEYKPSYYYTYNPKTLQYNLSHDSSINENVQYYKRLNGYSTIYRRVPIKEILINLLHAYAGEPYHNIIIQDLDTRGLELLEYRGEEPLYLTYNIKSGMYTNVYPNSIHCFEIEDIASKNGVKIHKIDSLQDGDYNSRIDSFTEDGAKEVYLSYIGVLESEMEVDFDPEDESDLKCGLYLMKPDSPKEPNFSYEIIRYNIESEDDFINNPEIKGIIGENPDNPKDVVYYDKNGTYESTPKYVSGVSYYYKKLYHKVDIDIEGKEGVCDPFTITRLQYGETAGYRLTDLVYPGELIANIGETITSVLDKIKNAFGDFEYFYDLDGRFIWRLKPTFVNTIANGLISAEGDEYADNAVSVTDVEYHFEDGQLITSYSNTPNLQNLRNDYSVWGTRKGVSGAEIPIHMRYAIDTKPKWYRTLHNHIYFTEERLRQAAQEEMKELAKEVLVKEARAKKIAETGEVGSVIEIEQDVLTQKETEYMARCHLVDWREIIYQMAKDYMQLKPDEEIPDFEKDNFLYYVASNNPDYYPTGITGYEHYYTDILGFWRQLYEPYSELDESGKLIEVTDSLRKYVNDDDGQKLAYKFYMIQDDENKTIDSLYINCDLEPIEIKEYNDWYSKSEDIYLNHIENDEPKNLYELGKIGNLNSNKITYYQYKSENSVINIDLYNVLVEKILTNQKKKEISIDEKWHGYVNNTEKDFLINVNEKSKNLNSENIRTYTCTFGRHYYLETIENNEVIGVELVKSLIDKDKITGDIYIKDDFGNFDLAKDLEDSLDPFSEYYKRVEDEKNYQLLTYELEVLENDEEGRTRNLKESCFKKKVTYEKVPELSESTWKNNYYYVEEEDEDGYTVYIKKENFETGYKDKWCEKIEEYVAEFSDLDSMVKEFYQGEDGKIVFSGVTGVITDYTKAYIQHSYEIESEEDDSKKETFYLFENYISNYIQNKDDASSFVTISYDKGYKKLDVNHSLYNYLVEVPSNSSSKSIYQTILLLNNTGYDPMDSSNQIPITYKYMYYNYFREGDKKYWNKEIIRNPATLNFWFDFLDSEQEYFDKDGMAFTQGSELNSYKVQLIGDRPKVINDKDVTSIYFREVPNLIFDDDNEVTAEEIIDYSGYIRIQGIPYDFFTISAQGKSAKDKIDELIYQHSYCIETINISALPVYYLQPNTRILITDKNSKIDGEYIVSRVSYSLTHNGTMSISATKAPTRIY